MIAIIPLQRLWITQLRHVGLLINEPWAADMILKRGS